MVQMRCAHAGDQGWAARTHSYSKNWRHEQAQGVRHGSPIDIAEPLDADLAHTEEAEAGPEPLVASCPGGPRRRRSVAAAAIHSFLQSPALSQASLCFVSFPPLHV